MRKKIIAGNWKMNKTPSEAVRFIEELKPLVAEADTDVVICVPLIDITVCKQALEGTNIKIGAQNMYFESKGAYTGEVSPDMLVDAGVQYIIIGHSERREYFSESNDRVNKKVSRAIEYGMIPILCCGETLEQREQGITFDHLRIQLKTAFKGLEPEQAAKVIIAYEPIWAIGTGRVATNQQAENVCAEIRALIAELYDYEVAGAIRILYGGSVTADNAPGLFAMPNIDGGLVGGASLKLDFAKIVNYKPIEVENTDKN
ncbi:MAG: triose-phosphate isomerase [Lachnospiraceae bacterium]